MAKIAIIKTSFNSLKDRGHLGGSGGGGSTGGGSGGGSGDIGAGCETTFFTRFREFDDLSDFLGDILNYYIQHFFTGQADIATCQTDL